MGEYTSIANGTAIVCGTIIAIIFALLVHIMYTTNQQKNTLGFYSTFAAICVLGAASGFIIMQCLKDTEYMCKFYILIALLIVLGIIVVIWMSKEPYKQTLVNFDVSTVGQLLQEDAISLSVGFPTAIIDPPIQQLAFDGSEALRQGEKKGFTISMYVGLKFPKSDGLSQKVNAKIPLFMRGNTTTSAVEFPIEVFDKFVLSKNSMNSTCKYNPEHQNGNAVILSKCPIIWLVLETPEVPTNSTTAAISENDMKVYFIVEFNQSRPEDGHYLTSDINDRNCKSVDPITATCMMLHKNARFPANSYMFNVDRRGSMLTNVTFVFQEDMIPSSEGSSIYDDVTNVSVYVNGKLFETTSYQGKMLMTSNNAMVLPRIGDGNLIGSGLDGQIAKVQFFHKPLSEADVATMTNNMQIPYGYTKTGVTNVPLNEEINASYENPLRLTKTCAA